MGKKLPYTPSSQIRQALRRLWLRSRERVEALRNTDYRCSVCGVKQSAAKGREVKLHVHHVKGVPDWEGLIRDVREKLLQTPEDLAPLCKGCHDAIHAKEQQEKEGE